MSDAREASIVAQAVGKITATLFQGTGNLDGFLIAYPRVHQAVLAETAGQVGAVPQAPVAVPQVPGQTQIPVPPQPAQVPLPDPFPTPGVPAQVPDMSQAVQNVQAGFPGAQDVTLGPDSSSDEIWLNFAQNPGDWFNNAQDDEVSWKFGKRPEIKHKTIKNGKYPLGGWLVDAKNGTKAPAWAWAAVGVPYPGA